MNLFDYLFACSFWQWIGTICLAGAICGPIAGLGIRIRHYHQNAPRYKGMNSGMTSTEYRDSTPDGINFARADLSGSSINADPIRKH